MKVKRAAKQTLIEGDHKRVLGSPWGGVEPLAILEREIK